MQKPRIIIQGSLLFDFFVKARQLPKPGQTIMGHSFGMFSGGKGANQAVQLARLGAEAILIGRVGLDFMGEFLIDRLLEEGMDITYIVRDDSISTGLCAVHVDDTGCNDIIVVPQANTHVCRKDVLAAKKEFATADLVLLQLETPLDAIQCTMELAAKIMCRSFSILLQPSDYKKVFCRMPT
jgi:ribokinase